MLAGALLHPPQKYPFRRTTRLIKSTLQSPDPRLGPSLATNAGYFDHNQAFRSHLDYKLRNSGDWLKWEVLLLLSTRQPNSSVRAREACYCNDWCVNTRSGFWWDATADRLAVRSPFLSFFFPLFGWGRICGTTKWMNRWGLKAGYSPVSGRTAWLIYSRATETFFFIFTPVLSGVKSFPTLWYDHKTDLIIRARR